MKILNRAYRAQQAFNFHLPPKSPWAAAAALINTLEYSEKITCEHCGARGELRFCTNNRGVSLQCPECLHQIGKWIPHRELTEIDFDTLPRWVQR